MGNGVGGQRQWRSEPDLAERRRQQQQQVSRPPAAAAYPFSSGATAQATGRRKIKNPVLRAIRAFANAPNKIGRAAGRSQQPPPLPPRAGRPPPPLPQQCSTPLGYMPERAFGLDQQQVVARPVPELASGGLSSSTLTLATANDRISPVPAPVGGRYLSQSCSNLVYGQQSNLYPPLSSLNTIEQESGSDSDVDSGEPRPENPQLPVYCAVDPDQERVSPRSGGNDEVDNEMTLYADLDEMHELTQKQGTDIITDPQSEQLSIAVRAATRARTMSPLHTVSQAEPSAPPMPSGYTLPRNADCSAVTNNQLGDRFIKNVIGKRQVYDDLIRRLTEFVRQANAASTRKARARGLGAGQTQPTVATDVSLAQKTLKELYYLHAILHGHAAEDMSVDLLPEVGQKAYSFWESFHQVILKHHEELDRADAVCAAEILRNPSASNLTSVLQEHFKMQRFLLQRQRAERNAELESVRRTVSANASWAVAAAEEAPAAAAAAGLKVAAARQLRTGREATARINSGSAVVAEGRAASGVAASAARAPADRTLASQAGSTRAIAALAGGGVTRAPPNEYHKPHAGGAQKNVETLPSVRHAPAGSLAHASAASATASTSVSAASPAFAVSPPDAAARAEADRLRPAEVVYSSLAAASAPAKASAAPHHLNSPAAVHERAPSAHAAASVAVAIRSEAVVAEAATATAAVVRELSAATSDSSVRRPLLVSCACQTDDDLSDGVSTGGGSSSSTASSATDAAVGAVHRAATACDPASGEARDRPMLLEAASGTSIGVPITVPSAERRRDAAVNSRATGDDGSACDRSNTAGAVRTLDNVAPSVASSDNPVYMLHSSDGDTARSSSSVAATYVVSQVIGAAEDKLGNATEVKGSGSHGPGRQPLAVPRIEMPLQSKLTPQQQQTAVEQLVLTSEHGDQTDRAASPARKEAQRTESGAVTTPTPVPAKRRVQKGAVALLSTPSPPASTRSAFAASGTSEGAGGGASPVDTRPRRETDVKDIPIGVRSSFGSSTAAAAEELAEYYELLEDGADSGRILVGGDLSVEPKLPSISLPCPSPVASVGGPGTGAPLPLGRSSDGLSVQQLHKEEEEEEEDPKQQQYATYEAVSEDAYVNTEERRPTTNKSTIDDPVTSTAGQPAEAATASAAARPADAVKLQPLSARSAVVKPRLDTRSGISTELATSPAGEDHEDEEPVYETMPCDEVPTVRGCGDAQVSVVQRVALKPMEDVLRNSVGQQQPPLLPLPRVTGAGASKTAAGAGDKSSRMPAKKKTTAKSLSATASRYALLTDDDDDQDSV